jgi:hypothetical protein
MVICDELLGLCKKKVNIQFHDTMLVFTELRNNINPNQYSQLTEEDTITIRLLI